MYNIYKPNFKLSLIVDGKCALDSILVLFIFENASNF